MDKNNSFQHVLIPMPVEVFWQQMAALIDERLTVIKEKEIQEKLLTGEEARNVFQPKLSRSTFSRYVAQGLIHKSIVGSTTYYKYSHVLSAAKTIKRYQTKSPADTGQIK